MEELLRVERDGASNSSSSQARHGEINNRARKTERISVMDRGRGQARGGTLKGVGREVRGRDEGVKVALLRSVSVNLAELSPSPRLRRTRRRVFKVKYFWFMGEIVTDGVGQWRT